MTRVGPLVVIATQLSSLWQKLDVCIQDHVDNVVPAYSEAGMFLLCCYSCCCRVLYPTEFPVQSAQEISDTLYHLPVRAPEWDVLHHKPGISFSHAVLAQGTITLTARTPSQQCKKKKKKKRQDIDFLTQEICSQHDLATSTRIQVKCRSLICCNELAGKLLYKITPLLAKKWEIFAYLKTVS